MNSSAKNLFKEINNSKTNNFLIDFSNVTFMSSSFAQEYLSQKYHTNKIIVEENVPYDVKRMLEVVKKDFK